MRRYYSDANRIGNAFHYKAYSKEGTLDVATTAPQNK